MCAPTIMKGRCMVCVWKKRGECIRKNQFFISGHEEQEYSGGVVVEYNAIPMLFIDTKQIMICILILWEGCL